MHSAGRVEADIGKTHDGACSWPRPTRSGASGTASNNATAWHRRTGLCRIESAMDAIPVAAAALRQALPIFPCINSGRAGVLLPGLRGGRGMDPPFGPGAITTSYAAPRPCVWAPSLDLSIWDRDELLDEHSHRIEGGREIILLTDGMRCAACAWLIDRALAREDGVLDSTANAVTGRIRISWDPQRAALVAIAAAPVLLGYRPYLAQRRKPANAHAWPTGVGCCAWALPAWARSRP